MVANVAPAYTAANVLVGQARMFLQKLLPTSTPALPANTVALNGAWPSTGTNIWVPMGATEQGLTFKFQRSTQEIMIEEQLTPVYMNTTKIDCSFDVVLSEDTVQNMAVAYGGGTVTNTVGTPNYSTLVIGSDMDQYAFGFEALNSFGKARRIMVPVVTSVGQVQTIYRRAADARRYSTTFSTLCAPEQIIVTEITS